eukprot:12322-Heterococcus_DN1.PRE.1
MSARVTSSGTSSVLHMSQKGVDSSLSTIVSHCVPESQDATPTGEAALALAILTACIFLVFSLQGATRCVCGCSGACANGGYRTNGYGVHLRKCPSGTDSVSYHLHRL